jgi:IclR family transcriptional regulator, KDG regulon repressor
MQVKNSNEKYLVPSLNSAGEILKYLSRARVRKATLSEISSNVNINKSTCYRILQTLVSMNFLTYDEKSKMFSLGPYLIVLGKRAEKFMDYMPTIKECMEEIVQLTNATCALVQRIDDKWFYMEKREPSTSIRVTINVGQRFKLTSGGTGKLFLAYMDREQQEKYINLLGLKKHTENTIVDKTLFMDELSSIREKGYAISIEEHVPGIDGVASPILDENGEVEMGLALIFLHTDHTKESVEEIGLLMKEKVKELSRKIYHQ